MPRGTSGVLKDTGLSGKIWPFRRVGMLLEQVVCLAGARSPLDPPLLYIELDMPGSFSVH